MVVVENTCTSAAASCLLGIFYSEFDNVLGPKILYQAPEDFVSGEMFESISDYIIFGRSTGACGKVVTLEAFGRKIMGYPLCIEDDKYDRNALLFNLGFVFGANADTQNTRPYEPLLRKLGSTLHSMEVESGFLFKEDRKAQLAYLLPRILTDLTVQGECAQVMDDANLIALKLNPQLPSPPPINAWEVPVLVRGRSAVENRHWDLALSRVVPFIDGVNFAKRIALLAKMDSQIVNACLRNLAYFGCIAMIDIFQYSNVYTTTPRVADLANDEELQAECAAFISKEGLRQAPFSLYFGLYSALRPDKSFRDICALYGSRLTTIDHGRFIAFGLMHSFIRRVHHYPICVSNMWPSLPGTGGGRRAAVDDKGGKNRQKGARRRPSLKIRDKMRSMMDGNHCADALSCNFMLSLAEVEEHAKQDNNSAVFMVMK